MSINITTLIMTLVNFVILTCILKHFLWNKLQAIIQERQDYIEDKINSAEEDSERARLFLLENERVLNDARKEGKKIVEKKKQKAEKVYSEIIADANKEAQTILDRARIEISREKEKAQYELKKETVNLAMDLSTKALSEKIMVSTQRELISDFITKVGK